MRLLGFELGQIQLLSGLFNSNRNSNSRTNHGVVTQEERRDLTVKNVVF